MAKFKSTIEYHAWCEDMVTRLYYANIAANDQSIRDLIEKIDSVLYLTDDQDLIQPLAPDDHL